MTSRIEQLIEDTNWREHELGPIESWPTALRATLSVCLAAREPMQIWWGPRGILFYNDACIPLVGAAHPAALGRYAPDMLDERWRTFRDLVLMPIRGEAGTILGIVCTRRSYEPRETTDFIALAGHELRQPLSALSTLVQVLMLKAPSREVELIMQSTDHLVRVLDDLAERSRHGTVPALVQHAELSHDAPEPADGGRRPRHVLLVEDNDDTARAFKAALEQLGYEVALAHDGPIALAVARSFKPDVVLLDIGLPVMDGWELARRLRETARELRFIAVTARNQDADKQRSLQAGFAEHFVKPVDLSQLDRLVRGLGPGANS